MPSLNDSMATTWATFRPKSEELTQTQSGIVRGLKSGPSQLAQINTWFVAHEIMQVFQAKSDENASFDEAFAILSQVEPVKVDTDENEESEDVEEKSAQKNQNANPQQILVLRELGMLLRRKVESVFDEVTAQPSSKGSDSYEAKVLLKYCTGLKENTGVLLHQLDQELQLTHSDEGQAKEKLVLTCDQMSDLLKLSQSVLTIMSQEWEKGVWRERFICFALGKIKEVKELADQKQQDCDEERNGIREVLEESFNIDFSQGTADCPELKGLIGRINALINAARVKCSLEELALPEVLTYEKLTAEQIEQQLEEVKQEFEQFESACGSTKFIQAKYSKCEAELKEMPEEKVDNATLSDPEKARQQRLQISRQRTMTELLIILKDAESRFAIMQSSKVKLEASIREGIPVYLLYGELNIIGAGKDAIDTIERDFSIKCLDLGPLKPERLGANSYSR